MHIQVSDKPIWLISILIMALSENGWHPPKDHFSRTAGGSPMDLGVPCCSPPARWGVSELQSSALLDLNSELPIAVGTTASSRSQWALPDLNCESQMLVGTAGPQRWAPELSGHCRTSTARARSQWALRDLNCKCKMSHRMSEEMSDRMPDRISEHMSDRISKIMPDTMMLENTFQYIIYVW